MYFTIIKEKIEKNLFFFTQAAQIAIDQFLGVNLGRKLAIETKNFGCFFE
jgi:hypothetical protein